MFKLLKFGPAWHASFSWCKIRKQHKAATLFYFLRFAGGISAEFAARVPLAVPKTRWEVDSFTENEARNLTTSCWVLVLLLRVTGHQVAAIVFAGFGPSFVIPIPPRPGR